MGDLFGAVSVRPESVPTSALVAEIAPAILRRCIMDRRFFGGLRAYRVSPRADGQWCHTIEVVLPPLRFDRPFVQLAVERNIAGGITISTLQHLQQWVEPC